MSLQYETPQETLHAVPSRFDLAVLGLRLMGIWLLVEAAVLITLFGSAAIDGYRQSDETFWSVALVPGVYLVLGIWFVFWPDGLARRLLPRTTAIGVNGGVRGADLQSIAFSAIGLLLVILSLQGALEFGYGVLQGDPVARFAAAPLVQLVAGLILFLQGRGLSALWQRLRTTSTASAGRVD